MAPSRFRDRFYTRPVARALTSPLGIVLAGAGAAIGIAIGLPIVAAVGIGAAAWAARVAAAIPKGFDADGIDPFDLADPWRTFVWQAKRSRRQFTDAVRTAKEGPLRERLGEIGDRITTGVEECWRVARSGQALTEARARIDVAAITKQLSELTYGAGGAGGQATPDPASALGQTIEALQSQLATAKRLDEVIADTHDRLRLLDARLGEAVTRAIELAARVHEADDLTGLSADVESVVGEMEALRVALTETDELSGHEEAGAVSGVSGTPGTAPATGTPGTGPAAGSSGTPAAAPTPGVLPPAAAPDPLLPPAGVPPAATPVPADRPPATPGPPATWPPQSSPPGSPPSPPPPDRGEPGPA
jgi:hypothetical protein